MKSHFNGTLATKSVEKMVGIYKTYAGMNHTGKTNELVKGFLKDAIDWSLSQPDLTQDTKLTVFNHWVKVIVLNHSELTVDLLKNVTKIDLRHVFKEGKIGERYVPTLSHGTSSTKTRYINGNAVNETTYDSYTTGGYDESRYGYTSVYQMFNESEEYYLIDLEVNATSSFTNYKTGKSWGGDEYKTKQSKENRISQKTQYLIRPKTQVKDQLIVGEKIPADFYLKVSKIQKLDKKWVDGLDSALEGNNLKLTQQYMADKSARNWLPQLGSVFAGQAFRELKHSIKVGDRFDKDFASTVIVTFENANSVAVEVGYQPNFSEKIQKMVIQPKSSVNQNVLAKGQSQSNLSLELLMIEPTK